MNLKSSRPSDEPKSIRTTVRGSALMVWCYLRNIAFLTNPPTRRFQVSRREIQRGTGIGSLNTIDNALEDLEAYGIINRHPAQGSNDGQVYELLTLDDRPIPVITKPGIVATLKWVMERLECESANLTTQQLTRWAKLTFHAKKLIDSEPD